jgi:acetyl-CoA acetyltransferase
MIPMSSQQAYLIDGVRTPIGNLGGALAPVRADDLAALGDRGEQQRAGPFPSPAVSAG